MGKKAATAVKARNIPKPNTQHPAFPLICQATLEQHDKQLHSPTDLAVKLLPWYKEHSDSREIPWRIHDATKTRGQRAYETWVSEIMCQQTQVSTVIPYFERWLAKYPTLKSLSIADEEDVRALWTGLGYYSRATRLLAGAKKVQEEYKGVLPDDPQELEKHIPGIGVYTAGAICSIAYGKRVPAVDGNVQRVYSRVFAIYSNPAAKKTTDFIQQLAVKLVPESDPGAYNQSLFDLGAKICTPKNPDCPACPLSESCIAYNQERLASHPTSVLGDIEDTVSSPCTICEPLATEEGTSVTRYPMAKIRKKPREEETATCLVEWRPSSSSSKSPESRYLLVKRPETGLLAGMLEFPTFDFSEPTTSAQRIAELNKLLRKCFSLPKRFNLSDPSSPSDDIRIISHTPLPTVRHRFSHIVRDYFPIHIVIQSDSLPILMEGKWYSANQVDKANISTGIATIWKAFLDPNSQPKKSVVPKKRKVEKQVVQTETLTSFFTKKSTEEVEVEQTVKKRKIRVIACSDDED